MLRIPEISTAAPWLGNNALSTLHHVCSRITCQLSVKGFRNIISSWQLKLRQYTSHLSGRKVCFASRKPRTRTSVKRLANLTEDTRGLTQDVHQYYDIILRHEVGQESSVGTATSYELDGPGIEFRCRSQWPSGLRRGSAADRLLGLRVRIPPRAWMFVLCVLHSKDNQDKVVVQVKCREQKRKKKQMPVLYVASKDKRQHAG